MQLFITFLLGIAWGVSLVGMLVGSEHSLKYGIFWSIIFILINVGSFMLYWYLF